MSDLVSLPHGHTRRIEPFSSGFRGLVRVHDRRAVSGKVLYRQRHRIATRYAHAVSAPGIAATVTF